MPKEIESLFIESLELQTEKLSDTGARRQQKMREKLDELGEKRTEELKRAS